MASLLLRVILQVGLSYSCLTSSAFNFKFYITSGTNDWVVSEQYPNGAYAVFAVPFSAVTAIPPETSWIWESPYIQCKTITITRYFFVPGKLISASFIGAIDDNGSAKINGGTSCSIPTLLSLTSCDFTSSVQPGLNKLEITAIDNGCVAASVAYKLTIVSNLA